MKDKSEFSGIKFGIFTLTCGECEFKRSFRTYNLDVNRSIKHILTNNRSPMNEHIKNFPGHNILEAPKKVLTFNNNTDLKLAFERTLKNENKGY